MTPLGYLLKILAADGTSVRRFQLAPGEHVVGSLPGVEVHLDEAGISRRHARIDILNDGGAVVRDLDSKNGTFLGERRVREAAVCGFTMIAFGSVQAVLQPADPARSQVLLGGPGTGEKPKPTGIEAPSTQGLLPMERLAGSLEEVLPGLAEGLWSPEEAASELAHRWLAVLPVGRVELLRACSSGWAVVAASATCDAVPRNTAAFEVEGPDGWKLLLRAPSSVSLDRLRPLFRLALASLAARTSRRTGARAQATPERARNAEAPPPPGIGPRMSRLYRRAGKVAKGEVPVLILGESGAGKEVMARWIHQRSPRAGGPFLAVNCAALPRDLLEAELFGIEKGVATGVEARPGLLERASGGTIFLDEVGDMAPATQAKLLRVLESTSLYRVGGKAPVQVDVRFLAATNRDLEALVAEERFRLDLFHRLAAFEVTLPPLRERREEIPSLAASFFHRELAKHGTASPGITRAALGVLVGHRWPGNVRELQNEIAKAALLLEPGEPLDLRHLSHRVRGERKTAAPLTLEETTRRAEREAFAIALAAAEGDAARAMELLGVSRTTYYRKLKELGLGESRIWDGDPGSSGDESRKRDRLSEQDSSISMT
ncbi:MAG TPA: sigma 54-interacting transcriptional regulator [Thermoanaerobaculia bacterium]|nr:sigma 54-interacting transcriptional regulator [Thermoanaerobaculia bacterium]